MNFSDLNWKQNFNKLNDVPSGDELDERDLSYYEFEKHYDGQLVTNPYEDHELYGLQCELTCVTQQKDKFNLTICTKYVDAADVPEDLPCSQWLQCSMCSCYPDLIQTENPLPPTPPPTPKPGETPQSI